MKACTGARSTAQVSDSPTPRRCGSRGPIESAAGYSDMPSPDFSPHLANVTG
jgi:hypothetical protein